MSASDTYGRTIQIFLVDGKPAGLRKVTLHGWTGLLFVSAASAFGNLTAREETDRSGVYILSGPDPNKASFTRVYIGSGNSVTDRIVRSARDRDFWETAITVTTSDGDLSEGNAESVKVRLIELAAKAGRVLLDKCNQPKANLRRLPEADHANMEQFLANLAIILPVIGLDMLEPQPRASTQTTKPVEKRASDDAQFEIRHKSGMQAVGVEKDGKFVVLEGSGALPGTGPMTRSYRRLKEKLIVDGVLIEQGTNTLRFARSWAFNSPSAAATVVLGYSSNGPKEWKVEDSTQSFRDWRQVQAKNQEMTE